MPNQKRSLKVFLCHAHADREKVFSLYDRLIDEGIDVWLDKKKLLPGQDWDLEIRKAVQESDVVVVCLSNQFNQEGFQQKEVHLALETSKEKLDGEIFIIPARLENCDVPKNLSKWHWVNLFQEDKDEYEMLLLALQNRAKSIGVIMGTKKHQVLSHSRPKTNASQDLVARNIEQTIKKIFINKNFIIYSISSIILLTIIVIATLKYPVFQMEPDQMEPDISITVMPCPAEVALDDTYAPPTNPLTNPIFQYAAPTPDLTLPIEENQRRQDRALLEARYAALELLKYEAVRWTKSITVPLDEANNVQILVTFLSPELLTAVFQNNILANTPKNVDVYAVMNSNLAQIAKRKELIFLVTVIVANPNGDTHILDLDTRQMSLKNSDGYTIPPQIDDHNLDQPINLSQRSAFGFLYYPLAIQVNGVCKQVLDPEYNRKINIETPALIVDSVSYGPFIWAIPYAPLVETGNSIYTPAYPVTPTLIPQSPITQVEIDSSLFSPFNFPPVDMTSEFFWRDFGRYVWGQITLGNY